MERADVQGLVLFGYAEHPWSRFFLLRFAGGEPREWLRRALLDISSGSEERVAKFRFNIAFSASGLSALGMSEDLSTFSREFTQGMAHPERSNVLGDRYADDPRHWEFGNANSPVDALAMLYARTPADLEERSADIEKLLGKFRIPFTAEDVRIPEDGREHFGFRDGIAEPHMRGSSRRRRRAERTLATGEFVLGYANAYKKVTALPTARKRSGTREHPFPIPGTDRVNFGHNGSYLVLRKLYQDVAAFWKYAWDAAHAEHALDPGERAILIASRFVGRWPNGVPLVQAADKQREPLAEINDFGYRSLDPHGLSCPFGAHIRRANPRDMLGLDPENGLADANLHRIIRRGRAFGPKLPMGFPPSDDGRQRGLYFVALNANIRRQFEFIQQSWINSSKFGGLSVERDPLLGKEAVTLDDQPVPRVFTVQGQPVRSRYEGLPKVVTVRGGQYFFLPGMRALSYLCDGAG